MRKIAMSKNSIDELFDIYIKKCVIGKRSIWFNGNKIVDKSTGIKKVYVYPRFEKYIETDFKRFR